MAEKRTSAFRYGVGMFGTSLPINMFRGFASAFYVIKLGLPMKSLSLILFIYTFIDAIDNPVYGILSDNTRTRFGRRKPWLVIGAPLFTLFFILFFAPPASLKQGGLFAWALIFYIITGTLDSLLNANYGALFPELFPEEEKRARTNGIRQIFQLVAMVIGIALTPMITSAIGYTLTAVIYGALALAVVLYMAFGIRELPQEKVGEKIKILPALISMVKTKNFWIAGVANAFYSAAMSLVLASVPFFIKYSLNLPDSQGTYVLGSVILVAILGVVLWSYLVKAKGVLPIWRAALITLAVSFIPLYFSSNLLTAILSSVLVGLGFAGVISTMDIIGAKIMDEDYQKYGVKREGIYSSAMGFMNRLSGLFVSLATFLAASIYSFESGDNPGPRPDDAARFMLTIFPFGLLILGIVVSFFLKFTIKDAVREIPTEETTESNE
ncbi:MAG: MFS transporter [Bacillota bacterium]|jgi:GPH family glycoside/pentoside/hexuronide:cation symporter|nr:MFS transporter [Bacillota bacterium]HHU43118.1 MFS transporter [Clostridiales bacterium]